MRAGIIQDDRSFSDPSWTGPLSRRLSIEHGERGDFRGNEQTRFYFDNEPLVVWNWADIGTMFGGSREAVLVGPVRRSGRFEQIEFIETVQLKCHVHKELDSPYENREVLRERSPIGDNVIQDY